MVWAFCSQSSRPDSSQKFSLALASDDLLSADTLDSKQIKCRTDGYIKQRMQVSGFRRVKPIRQMVDVFSPLSARMGLAQTRNGGGNSSD